VTSLTLYGNSYNDGSASAVLGKLLRINHSILADLSLLLKWLTNLM